MTDYAGMLRPDRGEPARTLSIIDKAGLDAWLRAQPARVRASLVAQSFAADAHQLATVGGDEPDDWSAVLGVADAGKLSAWCLAKGATLPAGTYRLAVGATPSAAALGWLLAQYRFNRYRKVEPDGARVLLAGDAASIAGHVAMAEAVSLVRDLVNTPAGDMGPQHIGDAAAGLAKTYGADLRITRGDALEQGFPLIAAVGRAADKAYAPRLIELEWGDPAHPRVAVIGKGVSFDTGGLDIKPASGMRLMKKDMGGAAHALALAQLIMGAGLPVRLHLLIPAAENAIAGDAFRPGDILRSRTGLSVEVHNTDAEGRLLLADALTRAFEDAPDLAVDFATLTGAARVALGPDLPAMFADDELADALLDAARVVDDPLWRLPLWSGYDDMLKSDVADIANASDSPFAGAVTAALFLRRFVPAGARWAHLDTFAWTPADKPGRPRGGEALGLRAVYAMLVQRYAAAH
ncbi:MAG TPA: leucyl aminopeptidase family protein [Sphingomonadaceae bacterium]|nr:leucyl aminopeptidase family protein [Sphingomonadaceae bacterium]